MVELRKPSTISLKNLSNNKTLCYLKFDCILHNNFYQIYQTKYLPKVKEIDHSRIRYDEVVSYSTTSIEPMGSRLVVYKRETPSSPQKNLDMLYDEDNLYMQPMMRSHYSPIL